MPAESKTETALKVWRTIRDAKWRTIGKAAAVAVLVFAGVAYWENRQAVYSHINLNYGKLSMDRIPHQLSDKTLARIKGTVDRSRTIVAASLVNIDFRKNKKEAVFFYADVPSFNYAMNDFILRFSSERELFISGNESNNQRMVGIINGDFVCMPVPQYIVEEIPVANKVAAAVCSISVPPYYGQIVGYLNLWVDHMPKPEEIPDLRAEARTMSIDVYERDVRDR